MDLFRSPERNEAFIALFANIVKGVWKAGDAPLTARLQHLMRGFRSSTDSPICNLGPEVYAAYPDAKYILTVRGGGKKDWWRSMAVLSWHFRRDGWRYLFRSLIYSVSFLRRNDDMVLLLQELWTQRFGCVDAGMYDKHNELIKKTVPPEKLLVFDVRDGWEPLCTFLGKEVPKEPFPNMNDSKAMNSIYFGMMMFGAFWWAVYFGAAAGAGYLVLNPEFGYALLESIRSLGTRMASRFQMR